MDRIKKTCSAHQPLTVSMGQTDPQDIIFIIDILYAHSKTHLIVEALNACS